MFWCCWWGWWWCWWTFLPELIQCYKYKVWELAVLSMLSFRLFPQKWEFSSQPQKKRCWYIWHYSYISRHMEKMRDISYFEWQQFHQNRWKSDFRPCLLLNVVIFFSSILLIFHRQFTHHFLNSKNWRPQIGFIKTFCNLFATNTYTRWICIPVPASKYRRKISLFCTCQFKLKTKTRRAIDSECWWYS